MQNTKICLIGLAMVLATLLVNATTGRLQIAQLRLLPVETFPRQIGDWKAGPDRQIDPDIQKVMPSARIVDRQYSNGAGQSVQLLLLTATDTGDFHNPQTCFPSQGWNLSVPRDIQVQGQKIKAMTAEQDAEKVNVLYWRTGYQEPSPPRSPLLRKLYNLRVGLVGKEEGMPLFVRVIATDGDKSNQALMEFVERIQAPLKALTAANDARTVQQKKAADPEG